jgi:carbonic anhydrase
LAEGYLSLEDLLPRKRSDYYTYLGGLTTPQCNGAVTWVVYKEPIYVEEDEVRDLK